MKTLLFYLVGVVIAFSVTTSNAQHNATPAVTWVLNADAAYAYSFNEPTNGMISYQTVPSLHNQFMLTMGKIGGRINTENVRGGFVLHAGSFSNANYTGPDSSWKYIHEAWAGLNVADGVWVDAGIFSSHIGFEGMTPSENWTFSRSLSADLTPYYETGAKVTYTPSNELLISALIVQGWQNIVETNIQKSVGTQIKWMPNATTSLNWSTYIGADPAFNGRNAVRLWSNLYFNFTIDEQFDVVLMNDVGVQQHDEMNGVKPEDDLAWYLGAIGRWRLSEKIRVAVRAETYQHPQGPTPESWSSFGFDATSASFTFDVLPYTGFMWRIEGRFFTSENPVYPSKTGLQTTDTFVVTSLSFAL